MDEINILDITEMNTRQIQRYNELFFEIKDEYTLTVDRLSKGMQNNIFWWTTVFASRNINLSRAQKQIALGLLVIEEINSCPRIERVIVDSPAVACTLNTYFAKGGIECCAEAKEKVDNCFFRKLRAYKSAFVFLIGELQIRHYVRSLKKNATNDNIRKAEALIQTHVFSSCFSSVYYTARDFCDLEKYLDNKDVAIFPFLFLNDKMSIKQLIKLCIADKTKFVFREEYLKLIDYFSVFKAVIFYYRLANRNVDIRGIDVSEIVKYDIESSAQSGNSFYGLLDYCAIKRMAEKKHRFKSFIGWYEGQPSSLGMFMSVRKFFAGSKTVGYVGYPVDETWIQCAPSMEQSRQCVTPEFMAVCGEYYESRIARYQPSLKVEVAPAFRLQSIYSNISENTKENSILVALPYYIDKASQLLSLLNESQIEHYDGFVIRNHPANKGMKLVDYGFHTFAHKCVIDDSGLLGDALSIYGLVVMPGTSTSVIEAVIKGTKVIVVSSQFELANRSIPAEWENRYYYEAKDSTELNRIIKSIEITNGSTIEKPDWEYYVARATKENVSWMF